MKYQILRLFFPFVFMLGVASESMLQAAIFETEAPNKSVVKELLDRHKELLILKQTQPKLASQKMESSLAELRHSSLDSLRLAYLYSLGDAYLDLGYLRLASKHQEMGLALAKKLKDTRTEADFYNQKGIILDRSGKWDEAIGQYKLAINLFKELKDSMGLAHGLNNLGLILSHLNRFESADSLFKEVLKLGEQQNNQDLRAMAYVNLGINKSNQGNFKGAEGYFTMALQLDEITQDPEYIGSDYAYLARVYSGMSQWSEAAEAYQKAIANIKQSGNTPVLADAYLNIANFYFEKKEYQASLIYIDSATVLVEKINSFPLLAKVYELEWQVHEAARNPEAALASYILWKGTEDSLQTWEAELASEELMQQYASEQNEQRMAELEEDVNTQKEIRMYWMILALLLGIGFILYIWQNSRMQKQSKELQKHQAALASNNAELQEKTSELEHNKESLQKALNTKTRFLSVVSHEIRTPLHVIRNIGELLTQDQHMSDESKEKLRIQLQSADQLNKLVDEIFDLNNLESGQSSIKTEIINLRTWLNEVYFPYQLDANFKGLKSEIILSDDLPEKVEVDSRKLRQVIDNLLSNAVKFTDTGKIQFKVSIIEKNDNSIHLRFSFSDTGIGLSEEGLKKVFEPFHQEDFSMSRSKGGSGLGLSISKGILELLGGQISVESKLGEGSTFHFDVKVASVKTSTISAPKLQTNNQFTWPKHKKLLIAEDHEQNILILKMLMNRVNAQAEWAKNGLECYTKAAEGHYDLILMDLHMPIMDGKEAAERIREMANQNGSNVRIIGLTAANESEVSELPQGLFDDVLYKPYRPDQLYQLMEQVVA
ncbi:MAG: tetratricopeptide repeat protein [Bacteroidetes bacterium]|nr:MAG: tetratricopeptide repeat protein [Bacteroidota bacterium]